MWNLSEEWTCKSKITEDEGMEAAYSEGVI